MKENNLTRSQNTRRKFYKTIGLDYMTEKDIGMIVNISLWVFVIITISWELLKIYG